MLGGRTGSDLPFPELRAGNLGVRIAATKAEIDAVQALRYRVFYDEMGAKPDAEAVRTGRDRDAFDAVADHLLVVDHAIGPGAEGVVGTYRLIQREARAPARPVLFGRRIRHRANPGLPGPDHGTRPLLRRCRVSQPRRDAVAVARHRGLCVPLPDRPDVRLRQPARHRPRCPGGRTDLSVPQSPRAAGPVPSRAAASLRRDAPACARTTWTRNAR